ncbi:MAG TPA: hypothetical protein VEL06_10710 [Haliangiales bacterium]|nr:hypothetical protein [Haliangiales bacterium]
MKKSSLLLLLIGLAFSGCGKKDAKSASSATNGNYSSGNPVTAPADYLGAIAKAKKSSEKTIDTVSLNQAIQQFNVAEGRYPKDLKELVTEKYLPKIPEAPYGMQIVYDAAKGEVKVVPKQ